MMSRSDLDKAQEFADKALLETTANTRWEKVVEKIREIVNREGFKDETVVAKARDIAMVNHRIRVKFFGNGRNRLRRWY